MTGCPGRQKAAICTLLRSTLPGLSVAFSPAAAASSPPALSFLAALPPPGSGLQASLMSPNLIFKTILQ